ncbi:outer membrane lipoprotein chaperone LolA [Neisseriaceae bacterium ESL0693]|nr:outer membrane lipoprotein chaperone LolA [Neisseriaceae bacterium ESL0693]
MKYLTQPVAIFALAATCVVAHAGGIAALQNFNTQTSKISGKFSQRVQNKKHTQVTSGTFAIQRPGLFRWEYTTPYQQTIVGDGKTVWLYDHDLAQVTQRSQNQTLGDSPAAILSNKIALNNYYALKEDGETNGVSYVRATPKKDDTGYQYIRIGFNGNTLASMQLKDSFGNQTDIQFSDINTQPQFTRQQFQFTPPKGVDVLSQ